MVIDYILDRKDGYGYDVKEFYDACMAYEEFDIARALDSGTEKDVKKALCNYVIDNDYSKSICKYINSENWLEEFEESKKSARKSIKESSNVKDSELREWIDLAIKEFKSMIKDRQKLILKGCKEGYEYGKELLDDYIHNTQGLDDLISQIRNCVKKYSIDYNFYYYLSAYGAFSSNWNLWDKLTDELYESKKSVRKSIKESDYIFQLDEFSSLMKKEDIIVKVTKNGYVFFADDETLGNNLLGYINPKTSSQILHIQVPVHTVANLDEFENTKELVDFIISEYSHYKRKFESKKSTRKSIKESKSSSILDDEFYDLIEQGYIYDEDENGMNMSYGEYIAVSDDLWETLENELKDYRDFPSAYDAYNEIMGNTSDDAKMFMGISDDDYFYFEINEDENTYSFSGEVPTVLEKLFKKFLKETDFERV